MSFTPTVFAFVVLLDLNRVKPGGLTGCRAGTSCVQTLCNKASLADNAPWARGHPPPRRPQIRQETEGCGDASAGGAPPAPPFPKPAGGTPSRPAPSPLADPKATPHAGRRKDHRQIREGAAVRHDRDAGDRRRPRCSAASDDRAAGWCSGPRAIWVCAARGADLARALQAEQPAFFTLTDRGHDLWAPVTGRLSWQSDRVVIGRPWPPLVAAWHDGGKEDPRLVLLPFDPAEADIWTEGPNLLAGLTLLLGADPKALRAESVARVALL